ncbi:MAG TPA: choice-of-anchor D domain-containing protein [Candidatus Latescibacteria bacterium]|jgi:hypothetical protein|nr:choice-of-anchor D domain-containing protein [Candidatus Latescibacterota bacterium]HJP34332.1 choice-of-anchor D domain-containing protein [Candidatus Latescibacterota bacterium]
MSRGKQGFTFVAALATVATMAVAPAFAVTTSGSVAATDERAPGPVANVVAFPGADGVEVTWDLSLSDFVRQSPTGSDFTSGGTFANVNDVAGYNVYRGEGALDPVLVGTVKPGETSFVDALPVGASFIYSVRAADRAGNESVPEAALEITLGPPPIADLPVDDIAFSDVDADEVVSESLVIANDSDVEDAILNVSIEIVGAGFAASTDLITLDPGNSTSLDISFAAADVGNINGDYEGVLTLRSNDPDNREVILALSASISDGLGVPVIDVSASALAFGSQRLLNTTGTRTLVVSNNGGLPLTGSIALSGDDLSTDAAATFELAADESLDIDVSFTPTSVGSLTGSLVITSNDADNPEITVSITGGGVDEVTTPNVIQATVTKATVTLADTDSLDFNDTTAVDDFIAQFIADLAELLGIDASRITGVTLTQGSIVVDFTIASTTDDTAVSAPDALDALETAVADTTSDPFPNLPSVESVADNTEVIALIPENADGDPVFGWFTRSEDQVGFNDFFAFADNFGSSSADETFDAAFDIAPTDAPNGAVDFDDFFLFADNFGSTVDNAATIRTALGE